MKISFPAELPISDRVEEISDLIRDNQVVIVAGETGSGKSTQIPKICVKLGLGEDRLIGHTQPRRLAARAIAERIAEETQTTLGDLVGYKVRFTDQIGKQTRIKLMTDGILLAEIQRDRKLSRYDVIIIDEAHERSLNIDFLLGYLRQLLPRRPDLKVIVTSATIDTQRFSEHFDDASIIEVSGRTYPVDVRYRPLEDPHTGDQRDQPTAICDAVEELRRDQSGDILVFCSGERDIRDAHDALEDLQLHNTEIFPLYARLSAAEQHRVFTSHQKRRIVLATNVAETSLTVPGIRTVIDPGNARISRYSNRTKVQRLPIESISQASANQRAGRCGRVGPGVCIRLYSEDDFLSRSDFTEPEIQRTNLASVILQMASLGLGDIAAFPFVEPPEDRNIRDGIALLEELDAVDPDRVGTKKWLTPMGRQLVKLPVDPRLGRMIVEAGRNQCLHEVMVIVAGMSVQDPRERPLEKRQAADEFHSRFSHPTSDFLTYVSLWDYIKTERRARSQNQFRRLCRREFLNFNRIREWQDIYRQLKRVADELNLPRGSRQPKPEDIHYSLLSGLLSHVGLKDEKSDSANKPTREKGNRRRQPKRVEYLGARSARFVIANGSSLSKKPPTWVMAGELVETNRLWARTLTQIDPVWAEQLGEHLVSRSYTEPWWEQERGAALTTERVSLYGLPLVAGRRRNLEGFNPDLSREMFIHHALIEGEWDAGHDFIDHNERLKAEIANLEARSRQADLMADQELLFGFFDQHIPPSVTSTRHFNAWWKKKHRSTPQLLNLTRDVLLGERGEHIEVESFPDHLEVKGIRLNLAYEFDPTSPIDGITVDLPVAVLNQMEPEDFSWLVPGFQEEAVQLLIRSLPKTIRKEFIPVPDTAKALLPSLNRQHTLADALRHGLEQRGGVHVGADRLDTAILPRHLRPTFRIVGVDNETLAAGKNLDALKERLESQIRRALESTGHEIEREGLTDWNFGELPRELEARSGNHLVRAFPALVDEGDSVSISLLATAEEQSEAMWTGTRRLLRLSVPAPLRGLNRALTNEAQLALVANTTQTKSEWFVDGIASVLDHVLSEQGGPSFSQEGFVVLQSQARQVMPDLLDELAAFLSEIVLAIQSIDLALLALDPALEPGSVTDAEPSTSVTRARSAASVQDARAHRDRLVYPGMLTGVGFHRLGDVSRYLQAIAFRLASLSDSPARDRDAMMQCRGVEALYAEALTRQGSSPKLEDVAWMIEDLRAGRFAPHLGSANKVSEKKVKIAIRTSGSQHD